MALTDNLVAYYKLDGNSNDSVGSNNGTDTSVSYSSSYGKINQGANFNGSNSKILISGYNPSDNFTIQAWALYKADNSTIIGSNKTFLYFRSDNKLEFPYTSSGTSPQVISDSSVSYNNWYHVVVTISSNTIKLYINNVLKSNVSYTGSLVSGDNTGYIGTRDVSATWFNGYIDELGIWSRALSPTEVTALYNSGAGLQYPFTTNTSAFFNLF